MKYKYAMHLATFSLGIKNMSGLLELFFYFIFNLLKIHTLSEQQNLQLIK